MYNAKDELDSKVKELRNERALSTTQNEKRNIDERVAKLEKKLQIAVLELDIYDLEMEIAKDQSNVQDHNNTKLILNKRTELKKLPGYSVDNSILEKILEERRKGSAGTKDTNKKKEKGKGKEKEA